MGYTEWVVTLQPQQEETKMSKNIEKSIEKAAERYFTFDKDNTFMVPSESYYNSFYETEEEAVAAAKETSVDKRRMITIYKAVKTVSFPAPTESSLKVEKVA